MQGHIIVAHGWAGASNPYTHPNPHTYKHRQTGYKPEKAGAVDITPRPLLIHQFHCRLRSIPRLTLPPLLQFRLRVLPAGNSTSGSGSASTIFGRVRVISGSASDLAISQPYYLQLPFYSLKKKIEWKKLESKKSGKARKNA